MSVYKEKRKSKRVKTGLRVNCKSEGIFFSDFTRDIGLDGIGIQTATFIREGTTVELFLQLPDEKEPLILKGRVVWAKVDNQENSSNIAMGIKFEDMAPHHRDKLNNFIERHTQTTLDN
jgi:uncharacterized protein (TIGR02266 family)